jgi:hypothetical protein
LVAGLSFVAVLILAAPAGRAQEPEIAVEASAEEVSVGETIDYAVDVLNVEAPTAPDLSAFRDDFTVVSLGDQSHNQSSTFIINGKVSQKSSYGHTYRYRLTPKRGGPLTIPAPTITVDGKTVSGRALSVRVIVPEPQDLVLAEIKASRTRVYPTQPFELTLRILVRPLPGDPDRDPLTPLRRRPPHLDVNWVDPPSGLAGEDKARWLQKQLADNGIGFTLNDFTMRSISFFEGPPAAVFNLYHGRESRNGLDGRPVNYFVYELKRTLTAEKAGEYSLGPAVVKGTFVSGMEDGDYAGRRLVVVAPAASVEVRDVPKPRPATYCGGIGQYRLTASAAPTALRVGDPLTLSLDIARQPTSGSLGQISAPDLGTNQQLAADFEIIDRNPTGRIEGDVKHFEYALRPKRTGVGIPAIAVSVFNPDTERFSDITSPPIDLSVSAASRVNPGDLVGGLKTPGASSIRSQAQGIFQNVTDPSELSDERVDLSVLASIAAGSWIAVAGLIAGVAVRRRKAGDQAWQRRRRARATAERTLSDARKDLAQGRAGDALRKVRSALLGLIADSRNMVAEGLTPSEANAELARTSVAAETRAAVARLLDVVESAEYGGSAGPEAPIVIEEAAALIPNLVRQLARDR